MFYVLHRQNSQCSNTYITVLKRQGFSLNDFVATLIIRKFVHIYCKSHRFDNNGATKTKNKII